LGEIDRIAPPQLLTWLHKQPKEARRKSWAGSGSVYYEAYLSVAKSGIRVQIPGPRLNRAYGAVWEFPGHPEIIEKIRTARLAVSEVWTRAEPEPAPAPPPSVTPILGVLGEIEEWKKALWCCQCQAAHPSQYVCCQHAVRHDTSKGIVISPEKCCSHPGAESLKLFGLEPANALYHIIPHPPWWCCKHTKACYGVWCCEHQEMVTVKKGSLIVCCEHDSKTCEPHALPATPE
jgi:hypothetical protein